jgi:hypothetical protein
LRQVVPTTRGHFYWAAFRTALAAIAALGIVACDSSMQAYPGQISKTFDGNKKLVLAAAYSVNAMSIGIDTWADVPVGTPAVVEVSGPLHIHCQGQFRAPDKSVQGPGLPRLDLGDGGGALFTAPSGHYTVVVTIPSVQATIQKGFDAGYSAPDPLTGAYNLNLGCVPVADTIQQLNDLLPQRAMAVRTWVTRMDDGANRAELMPLASEAVQAVQSGDTATALKLMTQIKDIVKPLATQNPYYDILRDALASIALLTQAPPAS